MDVYWGGMGRLVWVGGGWWRIALVLLVLLALVAFPLAGCGLGAGPTPTGVRLDVTRGFGVDPLLSMHTPHTHGEATVMSLLLRNATVTTRYGGGFVESIDGHSGGHEGGQPIDWFYYVNGVQASKGAADVNVHPGDRVWWDLHDWSQTEEVPAVVGSFPEPFLNGVEGLRLPVRVECSEPAGRTCHTVTAHLRAAGITSAVAELGPAGEEPDTLRLLVGTWSQVSGDPGARTLERGPSASGVYARPAASGEEHRAARRAGCHRAHAHRHRWADRRHPLHRTGTRVADHWHGHRRRAARRQPPRRSGAARSLRRRPDRNRWPAGVAPARRGVGGVEMSGAPLPATLPRRLWFEYSYSIYRQGFGVVMENSEPDSNCTRPLNFLFNTPSYCNGYTAPVSIPMAIRLLNTAPLYPKPTHCWYENLMHIPMPSP